MSATRKSAVKIDQIIAAQFCEWDKPDHRNAPRVVRSLAFQLATRLLSVIHGGRERYLIVIGALDEAGEAGRNPLVEMLAHNAQRLPDGLGHEHVFENH